eukprot:3793684-Pleurochrysis_carterae.AAC.1
MPLAGEGQTKTIPQSGGATNGGANVKKWAGSAKERMDTNAKCRAEESVQPPSSTASGLWTTYLAQRRRRRQKMLKVDPTDNNEPNEPQRDDGQALPHAWYAKPPKTSRMMMG